MERKKYLLLLMVSFMTSSRLVSAREYTHRIYEAFLAGNEAEWLAVMEEMEQTADPAKELLLELAGYYYGYTGYLLDSGQGKEAKKYIRKGEELVDNILKQYPDEPLALSYKGTFIAFKMVQAKLKMMVLGPQSLKAINKAYELDPGHYQIVADKANLLYYAPTLFGGDKEEAIRLYNQSLRQMEEQGLKRSWFYLSLQTSLAGIYRKRGEMESANRIYEQLQEIEPRYKTGDRKRGD
ncbi:MAG: hypothetical protein LUG98_03185 [Tannerellaceae bacterium]|nr:hypothetical protein [Tannerellaceae bacterium]